MLCLGGVNQAEAWCELLGDATSWRAGLPAELNAGCGVHSSRRPRVGFANLSPWDNTVFELCLRADTARGPTERRLRLGRVRLQ